MLLLSLGGAYGVLGVSWVVFGLSWAVLEQVSAAKKPNIARHEFSLRSRNPDPEVQNPGSAAESLGYVNVENWKYHPEAENPSSGSAA